MYIISSYASLLQQLENVAVSVRPCLPFVT